jgi:hypothetical protein
MVVIGLGALLFMKYVLGYPFPWEFRLRSHGLSPPDTLGLAMAFSDLYDDYKIDIVMGNMNHDVCNREEVIEKLKNALEKNIKMRVINGPEVDAKSKKFYELLENPNVELYKYPRFPELHFRVIFNKKGKPIKVYVEEPHRPFESHGFRCAKSYKFAKEYSLLFENMLKKSTRCKSIEDFKLVEHPLVTKI